MSPGATRRAQAILDRGNAGEIVAYASELLMRWQSNLTMPDPRLITQLRDRLDGIASGFDLGQQVMDELRGEL